jgi:two-component system sensor histidine kinase RegB
MASTLRAARSALLAVGLLAALPTPLAMYLGGGADGSLMGALVGAGVWMSLAMGLSQLGSGLPAATASGLHLLIDVFGFTLVLAWAGAAQNPLTMLYFVPMALSTLLEQRFTWLILAATVVGFSALLAVTASALGPQAGQGHFFHHIVGMAGALAVAGGLVTYFVHKIALSLAAERRLVQTLHGERQRDRVATSLGALAAGAAHELGTPLGTVQLLAGELDSLSPSELASTRSAIESEVSRMKKILHAMTSSQLSAEVLDERTPWTAQELATDLSDEGGVPVNIEVQGAAFSRQPRVVISQILRELVSNAVRASQTSVTTPVAVLLCVARDGVHLVVADHGPGMSEATLASCEEPFYSTTGGLGLGLFLAKVHVRQLGGELHVSSRAPHGLKVTIDLPLDPFLAPSAAS